jgi:hypothetical protein
VHAVLSFLTAGFWLIIWACSAICVSQNNAARMRQYEEAHEQWRHDYYRWQYGLDVKRDG